MDLIGTHRHGCLGLVGTERHTSLRRLRVKNVDRAADNVVDIELLQFDRIRLLQQSAEMRDDVRGALIVPAYVGQDFLDPRNVRRISFEIELRGLGVAVDRAQRLIELMGDGSRQRARGRRAVQVHDLQQATAQFLLRDVTAAALEQQAADQQALRQHDREDRAQVPAILVPQAELAKADFTSRRQPVLADSEALKLAPVEDRPGKVPGGDRDI